MWNEEQIIEYLKEKLKKSRYEHSLSVRDTAIKMAKIYNADVKKAGTAGLVHDCAKYMSNGQILSIAEQNGMEVDEVARANPQLLHGSIAAVIAKNIMGICDEDILSAVKYHTTGKKNMNILEKIVYISDYIEPLRDFPGVEELREKALTDLNGALLDAFNNTIKVVISRNQLLHLNTIQGRNYLIYKTLHL
ncbi:bis(5'-nucleosyl)-tetraphosphatase (symmetrical) YqeK [Clostridium luticellarii]|jgi:predicted HD superfamily hydrolase involved in NAD metabolism|uniref:bis(5'-nucleosyl)-tetraphosphatase (symmetrical) n=1 Tax=Clostridium luticellarii TaxID=1691940 RepID=A0A2T0BPF9_9CLOT|nr:bis(5'-nucleosyl)-tetraphosphatase (symmetrical) YqeK [Clostridium luticellarii]MCI1945789.1 bis(5'-nucleosyl)-tetraphosphatase (symmetrical) YqeK [Clostridium luticellarii]MCI1967615.1 bis(5'-nucleosyl)-tetraphosphatase (symmetrical) YqeK [Clostridium luticellarii]MCI1996480.1 bis(5'-nucleosyl)-tetraphosphatase (symmetrical) YqeK [Clostridium luticellarii]MCI2041165.1 bis(5'-nucleosyl)-tetraphosphatase (symmetrical) YqeK [Clostridium luticellarii]PRR85771.1 putative nicotinate-nucleotide a